AAPGFLVAHIGTHTAYRVDRSRVRWARTGQTREHRDEADKDEPDDRCQHSNDEFRGVCWLKRQHDDGGNEDQERDAECRLERERIHYPTPRSSAAGRGSRTA